MELVYRIRENRLDRHGRAAVTADLHWGSQRLQQVSTGVKVMPANWQPAKKQQINTREADANGKNLKLANFAATIGTLFSRALAEKRPETSITPAEVRQALEPQPEPEPVVETPPTAQTLTALHERWQEENAGSVGKLPRRYTQVVGHLTRFRAGLTLGQLTRKLVADYQLYTQRHGVSDSTFRNHVKFLREAYRTAGLNPPRWLAHRAPESRPLSLTGEEFRQLLTHAFPAAQANLAQERDVFALQTLLLLRDSDVRRLRPGYVREMSLLLGEPPVLVASMPQKKTKEELVLPLAPLAAQLWRAYQGKLPVVSQQNRNERMKNMAAVVGLTREVVKVRWVGGKMHETPLPLHQALTSHAARHTGADLLLAGSGGDRNLVEIALGHVNHVYGHDSIYRYGPQLLAAWAQALAGVSSVGSGQNCQRLESTSLPDDASFAA